MLNKSIGIEIDFSSWPTDLTPPVSFLEANDSFDVNIPTLLLLIGFLTTPSHASGVTLSEFWAWVRYLNAISFEPDLRITEDFFDLDAHQKTIMSDDFGMGMAIYWLFERLGLEAICDGRYFIDRVAATVGATTMPARKRGPTKSPDFIIRDQAGIWHVVECKGTQSGVDYRNRQLGAAGALAQKNTVIFPAGYSGQRLGCGLCIAKSGGVGASSLRIIDPVADEDFVIDKDQMIFADDAVVRAVTARSLRLSGFGASASAMSAPSGRSPRTKVGQGRAERTRQEYVEAKRARAVEELREKSFRATFQNSREKFRGRSITVDLPVPIQIDGGTVTRVKVRNGVNNRFLNELTGDPLIEEILGDRSAGWEAVRGKSSVRAGKRGAQLKLGDMFVSELALE